MATKITKKPAVAETWEETLLREEIDFVGRWNWSTFYSAWTERLDDFNVNLTPLFQSITVHDPKIPEGREPKISWWPTKRLSELHKECQSHLDRWPGSTGLIHPEVDMRKGVIDTVNFLWEHRENPEGIAGILIAGSIFSRVSSRSRKLPEYWPRYTGVRVVERWAYQAWRGSTMTVPWHHASTWVLPKTSDDWIYKVDTIAAFARYLADEHAALLLSHRPVVIEYVARREPNLRSV